MNNNQDARQNDADIKEQAKILAESMIKETLKQFGEKANLDDVVEAFLARILYEVSLMSLKIKEIEVTQLTHDHTHKGNYDNCGDCEFKSMHRHNIPDHLYPNITTMEKYGK